MEIMKIRTTLSVIYAVALLSFGVFAAPRPAAKWTSTNCEPSDKALVCKGRMNVFNPSDETVTLHGKGNNEQTIQMTVGPKSASSIGFHDTPSGLHFDSWTTTIMKGTGFGSDNNAVDVLVDAGKTVEPMPLENGLLSCQFEWPTGAAAFIVCEPETSRLSFRLLNETDSNRIEYKSLEIKNLEGKSLGSFSVDGQTRHTVILPKRDQYQRLGCYTGSKAIDCWQYMNFLQNPL